MRTVDSIRESLSRFGYAHLKRSEWTITQVSELCSSEKMKLVHTGTYHFTVESSEAPAVSGTDFEAVRKQQFERRQKLAAARKKKEQNT